MRFKIEKGNVRMVLTSCADVLRMLAALSPHHPFIIRGGVSDKKLYPYKIFADNTNTEIEVAARAFNALKKQGVLVCKDTSLPSGIHSAWALSSFQNRKIRCRLSWLLATIAPKVNFF